MPTESVYSAECWVAKNGALTLARHLHDAHVRAWLRIRKAVARTKVRRRRVAAEQGREIKTYQRRGHDHLPYIQKPGVREQRNQQKREKRVELAMAEGRKPGRHSTYALHDAHVLAHSQWLERQVRALHNAHVNVWRKECSGAAWAHRYRTDPEFNAKEKLRTQLRKLKSLDADLWSHIAESVKADSFRKTWPALLGYDLPQLVRHLKLTLPKGATWQDFLDGELHIDHITPRAVFDLTNPDEIRRCWCLSNLRLLPWRANIAKGARVEVLL
jgi:hypothetical protein